MLFRSYGAGGAVVLVLLWVYYSAQVLFFGAEFTQVYASRHGSRVRPAQHGTTTVPSVQHQQGSPSTEGTSEAPKVHEDQPAGARPDRPRPTAAADHQPAPTAERRDLTGGRLTDHARMIHVAPNDVEGHSAGQRQASIRTGAAMLLAAGLLWKLTGEIGRAHV